MRAEILELPLYPADAKPRRKPAPLREELEAFHEFGKETKRFAVDYPAATGGRIKIENFVNEF